MNRILGIIAVLVLVAGGIWYGSMRKEQPSSPSGAIDGDTSPGTEASSTPDMSSPGVAATPMPSELPNAVLSPTATQTAAPVPSFTPPPSVKVSPTPGASSSPVAVEDDEGDFPIKKKTSPPPVTPAEVKGAKVWLVASDLRDLPNVPSGGKSLEVGIPEGSKATRWKNRAGLKTGDAIRIKATTNGTFIPDVVTSAGSFDAVLICAPDARDCANTQATQLKIGPDVNHADHWLSGPDKSGKSSKGGSSFTTLFVAARGSANGNPLMEHQNGDAGSNKGPFLGWIGRDLVASIHGSQGSVGVSAVAIPSAWSGKIVPQIYTVRFDRKKGQLGLFVVGEKGETAVQAIEKGDGPDNDEYAGIAMGSKSPGVTAATYVFEQATFARALDDKEICAIHKEWNIKYSLKITPENLKPCRSNL